MSQIIEKRTMDFEYRDYQTINKDGQTFYFKPESPNILYTKEALPKTAKPVATPVKTPVKIAPPTVTSVKPVPVAVKVPEKVPDDFYKPNGLEKLVQAQDKNKPEAKPVKETNKATVIKWND